MKSIFIYLKLLSCLIMISLIFISCQTKEREPGQFTNVDNDTLLIFNGKNFTGWQNPDNRLWKVASRMLIGSTMDTLLRESVWITTIDSFENFELTCWVKLTGESNKNSGIYYRGEWDDIYVVGYEYDFGGWGDDAEELWWGQLHDPYRREDLWIGPEGSALKGKYKESGWNYVRIKVQDNHIQHWLNDHKTVDWYEKDPSIQKTGFIAFQLHSESKSEVYLKQIRLIKL